MAYCFPPRGFAAPATDSDISTQQNANSNGIQQSVIQPSSFLQPEQNRSSYTFPPTGSNQYSFPPRAPNPNQFSNGQPNPWGGPPNGHHIAGPGMGNPHQHYSPGGHPFPRQPGHHGPSGPRFFHQRGGGGGKRRGNNRKGQNKHQGKKKDVNSNNVKVKETELKYNCDVCDRGFKSEEILQTHLSEHVKCSAPGCKFEAHVKVVQLHKKMQHGGNKFKIQWMESPEEIKRWRAERRKNYPTAANMEKKQHQQNRRETSGSVLQTKQFGKMQKFSNKRKGNNKDFSQDKHAKRSQSDAVDPPRTDDNQTARETSNKTPVKRPGEQHDGIPSKQARVTVMNGDGDGRSGSKVTDPLSLFAAGDDGLDHEKDVVVGTQAEVHLAPSGSIGSLGSLAAAYGDDDSSESESTKSDDEKVHEAEKDDKNEIHQMNTSVPQNVAAKHERCNPRQRQAGQKRQRGNSKQSKQNAANRRGVNHRKPTLLEMLLAPDIRHERNVLLQCVRYVVSHNFFQDSPAR